MRNVSDRGRTIESRAKHGKTLGRGNPIGVCVAALALAACGPSSKEISGAKSARYKADKLVLFNAAKSATEPKFHLAKSDETALGFETVGRWYNPEGQLAMEGNTNDVGKTGHNSVYPDNSINLVIVVKLLPDGDAWVVQVSPVMARYHAGAAVAGQGEVDHCSHS